MPAFYGLWNRPAERIYHQHETVEFDCFTCTFPTWCTNSNNLPFWKQLIGDYCVVDFCLKCDKETILAQSITLLWDDKQTVNYKQPCIIHCHSDDLAGVGTKLPSWLGNRIILQLHKNKGRFKICFLIISLLYQVYKLSWLFFQFLVTSLQIIYLKSEEKLQVDHFWG